MAVEAPFQAVIKGAVDQIARSLNDLGSVVANAIEKAGGASTNALSTVLTTGFAGIHTGVYNIDSTLGLIKAAISSSLTVSAIYPDGESNVYSGFQGSITSTNTLTVWTPSSGKKFKLKGYAITGVLTGDATAGGTSGLLVSLYDAGNSGGFGTLSIVAPIAAIHSTVGVQSVSFTGAANGTTSAAGSPVNVDLGSGRLGAVAGGALKIAVNDDLGSSTLSLVGVVWGREV